MIDPQEEGVAEAFRAGTTSTVPDLARAIDAMWSQALQLAKQIQDGELPTTSRPSGGGGGVATESEARASASA